MGTETLASLSYLLEFMRVICLGLFLFIVRLWDWLVGLGLLADVKIIKSLKNLSY